MKKEKFFKFFNLFSKKDILVKQKEKKFSKILSYEFKVIDGYDIYLNNCIVGEFKILCDDDKIYYIVAKTDEYASLNISFHNENFDLIKGIKSFGYININNGQMVYNFSRIEMLNYHFKGYGIPHLMMAVMFKILDYYADKYDVIFTNVTGVVGIGGGDTPERSIPLYKSFNGYNFNGKKIILKEDACNIIDREIFYNVV